MAILKARKAHSGTHKTLTTVLIWVAIASGAIALVYSQNHLIITDKLYFKNNDIPKSLTGFKIANISEINNTQLDIVSKVEKMAPDVIVLSGGYYDNNGNYDNSISIVTSLAEIAPVYYVYSLEDKQYMEDDDILSGTNAMNITNQAVAVQCDKSFDTFMLDTYGEYMYNKYNSGKELYVDYGKYLQKALKETEGAEIRIVGLDTFEKDEDGASKALQLLNDTLDMSPKAIDIAVTGNVYNVPTISQSPVDAIFTGGTYGKGHNDTGYNKGIYNENGTKIYVSGGIGTTKGVTRISNFPQIECITITDGSVVERNPLKNVLNSILKTDEAIDSDDGYQVYKQEKSKGEDEQAQEQEQEQDISNEEQAVSNGETANE